MGKDIGCSLKYNQSKISTPTLQKHFLSSSTSHTSSASNLTQNFISSHLDNKDSTVIQNKKDTYNTDHIHSCVTPRKQNYSIQATYTPPRLNLLNTTVPIAPAGLHTRTKLPPVSK